MAVSMHIPVFLALISLFNTIRYCDSHITRQVIRDMENDGERSIYETLPRGLSHRRDQLQRESSSDLEDLDQSEIGQENHDSSRRQLMAESGLGPQISAPPFSLRVRHGRIMSKLAEGSMDPEEDEDEWLVSEETTTDTGSRTKSVVDITREIASENARIHHRISDEVISDDPEQELTEEELVVDDEDDGGRRGNENNIENNHGNCSHCLLREEMKRIRIETIRQQILRKLRLKSPPNITRNQIPNIPDYIPILRYLDRHEDSPTARLGSEAGQEDFLDGYEDYYVTTIRSYNFGEVPPSRIGNDSQICYVTFKDDIIKSRIVKATLWVKFRPSTTNDEIVQLRVFKRERATRPGGQPRKVHYRNKRVRLSQSGEWQHMDIRNIVTGWTQNPDQNYGLLVEAEDSSGKVLPIIIPQNEEESSYKPFVEVRVKDVNSNRHKRMLSRTCQEDDTVKHCCRYPLRINFEDFGWDWVIAPKSYDANYCSGECPYVYQQNYQHTHIVQQAVPHGSTVCCTPRKMHSLSMLYFADTLNVIYGKVPDMVVETCGCA